MPLTEEGYQRPSYDEIVAQKEQRARELFGQDIDTSEQTALGKFIRINAYDLSKSYEDLENVYYARFPNTASGVSLDRLCTFAGITRNPAEIASHNVKVIGDVGKEIQMGELIVGTPDGVTFYNSSAATIGDSGYENVVFTCTTPGSIGNVGEITQIVNPVLGINDIEYINVETLGKDIESDYDLRKRFSIAISGAGACTPDSIRGAVARVQTVESVKVEFNENDTEDAAGRPPHSFEVYVYGGDDYEQEIAETIFDKKPVGIKTVTTSNEQYQVHKTIIDSGGYTHDIYFSKVAEITTYIKVEIKVDTSYSASGETQIKNKLISYIDSLGVGGKSVTSAMYSYIFDVAGVVEVQTVKQSLNGINYSSDTIQFAPSEVPTTNQNVIQVSVI